MSFLALHNGMRRSIVINADIFVLTDFRLHPTRAVTVHSGFGYLEPLRVRRVKLVARRVTAGRHVCHQRTSVVWPLTWMMVCQI